MRWLIDCLYLVIAAVTAPVWLYRMLRTGKIQTDWRGRFGHVAKTLQPPVSGRKRLLLHAVSVGEINAIRQLVDVLAHGGSGLAPVEVVIATTTDTGFARATALWGEAHAVVRYPFDLSWMVHRFLRSVQPDVVALIELEVWPNFTAACRQRGIPIGVINGRLTERSFRRYKMVRWLVRPSFARLAFAAVQNDAYAARFKAMGTPPERVHVTGTMKWDAAQISDEVAGAAALQREMGIDPARPLIVAGSTAPDEHALLHRATPPGVQLLCAPRRPEWFEHAAESLPGAIRRTHSRQPVAAHPESEIQDPKSDRFLLDTIGELRQAYALADLVVIGRSFGTLHGSDMMEPAALGKPVIVGPAVSDFQDTVDAMLAGGGIVQISADDLPRTIAALLADAPRRRQVAANAREVIRAHQGATQRHVAMLMQFLGVCP